MQAAKEELEKFEAAKSSAVDMEEMKASFLYFPPPSLFSLSFFLAL
jgi:hypothetical protein